MTNRFITAGGRTCLGLALLGLAAFCSLASSSKKRSTRRAAPGAGSARSAEEPLRFSGRYGYRGSHPVHPDFGRGFCRETGAHQHVYAPFEPELFTVVGGQWVFIGDPADFDYDGPVHWFANPHPFGEDYGDAWCYYPWPHRHHFALGGDGYNLVGGILYFVGAFTESFYRLLAAKRQFFGRRYRGRYLRGALYRHRRPRYVRLGNGRYRRVRPRHGRRARSQGRRRRGRSGRRVGIPRHWRRARSPVARRGRRGVGRRGFGRRRRARSSGRSGRSRRRGRSGRSRSRSGGRGRRR